MVRRSTSRHRKHKKKKKTTRKYHKVKKIKGRGLSATNKLRVKRALMVAGVLGVGGAAAYAGRAAKNYAGRSAANYFGGGGPIDLGISSLPGVRANGPPVKPEEDVWVDPAPAPKTPGPRRGSRPRKEPDRLKLSPVQKAEQWARNVIRRARS
jgi:hypothetical protein